MKYLLSTTLVVFVAASVPAQFEWNPSGLPGPATGGSGLWDDTSIQWTDPGTLLPTTWNSQVAVFGGLAGTVELGKALSASGMTFTTTGYILVGGTGGFNLTLTGGAVVTTNTSITATINAVLSGSAGLDKQGAGTLILGAANTFTGTINIGAGTLRSSTVGALNTRPVQLAGGTLDFATTANQSAGALTVTAASTLLHSPTAAPTSAQGNYNFTTGSIGNQTLTLTRGGNTGMTTITNFTGDFNLSGNGTLIINNGSGGTTAFAFGSGFDGAASASPVLTTLNAGPNAPTNAVFRVDAASTNMVDGSEFLVLGGRLALGASGTLGSSATVSVPVRLSGTNAFFEVRNDTNRTLDFQDVRIDTNGGILRTGRVGAGGGVTHTLRSLNFVASASVTLNPGQNINTNTTYGMTFAGPSSLAGNPTYVVNNNGTSIGTLSIGSLNGNGTARTITKSGPGTLILSSTASSVTAGSQFNLSAGGVRLAATDALGVTATNVALGNGTTITTGTTTGFSNSLGTLSVNGTGTIGFAPTATNAHSLTFTDFNATGFTSLTISNWVGADGQPGTVGKLLFTNTGGFTPTTLNNINFTGYTPGAMFIGNELVPVPEPALLGLLAVVVLARRRV